MEIKKTENEKLNLNSMNISEEKQNMLLQLFPEIRTDGGKIDFERLRLALGQEIDTGKERYGMSWPGKNECFKTIQAPSMGALLPQIKESENFKVTENLIIEGDNLESLKILQKSYLGKIKFIYIDPPYNTGSDFIYPDNFSESLQTYLEYTGQIDSNGKRFGTNLDSDGRFHSKWLNMMYPRLYLARNLLKEDGLICISINDKEVHNLRKICDEIFGEGNFCAQFVWHSEGNTDNQLEVKIVHEYIVAYYRNVEFADRAIGHVIDPNTPPESNLWKGVADNNINKNNPANPPQVVELPAGFPSSEKELFYPKKNLDEKFFKITKTEKIISDEVKKQYQIEAKSGLPIKIDDLIVQDYKLIKPCRIYGGLANKEKLEKFIANGCQPIDDDGTPLSFYINVNAGVRYHRKNDSPRNILSVLRGLGTTEKTRTYLKSLGIQFDYPKPVALLEYLIRVGCEEDEIVLDFFAGSGTTGEATIRANLADGANRKFILIQLPEKSDQGVLDISKIAISRMKLVVDKIKEEFKDKEVNKHDTGFKVFRLAESNFKTWNPDASKESLEKQLEFHVEHVKRDRTADDILYEILLKSGFSLTTKIETQQFGKQTVYSIADGMLLICLEGSLTLDLIKHMAEQMPARVVCLDQGFANNDQLKANAVQIFKTKGIASFKTV